MGHLLLPTFPALVAVLVHGRHSQIPSFVEIQNHAEFESILTDRQMHDTNDKFWSRRSEASGHKTLRLEDETGKYIAEFNICAEPITAGTKVSLQLENIRYSNDGRKDILKISMNNVEFGGFKTFEKWGGGHGWNIFHESGRLGGPIELEEGRGHRLRVTVRTDKYGVELDRITMNAINQKPDKPLFCGGRLKTNPNKIFVWYGRSLAFA